MAPRKLSEADKQDILSRYRQTEETTATLANRYGVSTSTVSRILKQNLPDEEYEALIQQKRIGAFRGQSEQDYLPGIAPAVEETPEEIEAAVEPPPIDEPIKTELPTFEFPKRRQRKRIAPRGAEETRDVSDQPAQLELTPAVESSYEPVNGFESAPPKALLGDEDFPEADLATELEDEELEDEELEDEELDELDDELDDLDEDDEDDDLAGSLGPLDAVHIQIEGKVKVVPLSEAAIPRVCYVVVDRSSELITRPLKDFAELGQIPSGETLEKTLPIFDNHRVAKRFMRRMQRIVKVPDGRIFCKVGPYLQAKGITRVLIDGHVYSL